MMLLKEERNEPIRCVFCTFNDLKSTVERNSLSDGSFLISSFVEEFCSVASEAGDAPDMHPVKYCRKAMQVIR